MAGDRRPFSPSIALGLFLVAAAAVLAISAGFGHRAGWWSFGTGFSLLRWAVYGALAALVLLVAGTVAVWRRRKRRGLPYGVVGAAVALSLVLIPFLWLQAARSVPPIHDITTDLQDPPRFDAILPLRTEAPNPAEYGGPEVARQQRQGYPDLGPLRVQAPVEEAFAAALAVARDMDWRIIAADPQQGRIEAVATTFWFGFKDDVVVRLREADEGTRVDVRSVSRVGRSDVGTNARRIRSYLSLLAVRTQAEG